MGKSSKDNDDLKISILIVFITVILTALLIGLFWYFMDKKSLKAKPVINYGNRPEEKNTQPFLTSSENLETQPSSGYNYSTLGQPCSNNSKSGIPNLPDAYENQPCDESQGLVCVDGIYNLPVCLSAIGSKCKTINDCVPDAEYCLNGFCSKAGDTLNQNCFSDLDCNNQSNGKNLYNHTCVKESGKTLGICKVDNILYDSGCNTNNDCIDGFSCLQNQTASFILKTDAAIVNKFQIISDIPWQNITNNIITVSDKNNKLIGYYNISSYDTNTKTGQLVFALTTNKNLDKNTEYYFYNGRNPGICVEKIPAGGSALFSLGGVSIPCQDGLKNIENYCLSEKNPNLGQTCISDVVKCGVLDTGENKIKGQLSCSYDQNLEENILSSFTYGISPGTFPVYQLGSCVLETQDFGQDCDNKTRGCKEPYFCLQENLVGGQEVSICGVPFQPQICVNDKCLDGYECNGDFNEPLCLGKSDAFALVKSDCSSKTISNDFKLLFYDIEEHKYKTIIDIDGNIMKNTVTNYKISLSQSLFYNTTNNNLPIGKNYNKYVLIWYQDGNNYKSISINLTNNSITHNTIAFSKSGDEIADIIFDEDDNIFAIYKSQTSSVRKRSFKITNTLVATKEIILEGNNHGLVKGEKVYYQNDTEAKYNILDTTSIYYILEIFGNGFIQLSKDGTTLSDVGAMQPGNHYLVTYSNKFLFLQGQNINGLKTTIEFQPLNLQFNNYLGNTSNQLLRGDKLTYKENDGNYKYELISFTNTATGDEYGAQTPNSITSTLTNNKEYYVSPVGSLPGYETAKINTPVPNTNALNGMVMPGPASITTGYILSYDYHGSMGGYPLIYHNNSYYKSFAQQFQNNNMNVDGNNYFVLFENACTYKITLLGSGGNLFNNNSTLTVTNNLDYIDINNQLRVNGLNEGFSYSYDTVDNDVQFQMRKYDGENYLMLNKKINYTAEENNVALVKRKLQHVIKFNYNISTTPDETKDYIFAFNANSQTYYMSYNIQNNSSIMGGKGFHYNYSNAGNDFTVDSFIDEIELNPYIETGNLNLFYTMSGENTNNKKENTIGINSIFEPINIKGNEPTVDYKNYNNFTDLKPLVMSRFYPASNKPNNNVNYFVDGENFIYIHDENDINNILNFSSSELVISKTGTQNINPSLPSQVWYKSLDRKTQILWAIVNIVEYDVDLNGEYMKIKINFPTIYNDENNNFSNYKKLIDDTSIDWLLYVYNFVPLSYNIVPLNRENKESNLFSIDNASLLYTSSKVNGYFEKTKEIYSRSGYNHIMMEDFGFDNSESNQTTGSKYSVYSFYDGCGTFLKETGNGTNATTFNYINESGNTVTGYNYKIYKLENDGTSYKLDENNIEEFYQNNSMTNFYSSRYAEIWQEGDPNINGLAKGTIPSGPQRLSIVASVENYTYEDPVTANILAMTNNDKQVYVFAMYWPGDNNNNNIKGYYTYDSPNYLHPNDINSNSRDFVHFYNIPNTETLPKLLSYTAENDTQLFRNIYPLPNKVFKVTTGPNTFKNFAYTEFEASEKNYQINLEKASSFNFDNKTYIICPLYGGYIRLTIGAKSGNMFAVNNLFLSSLPQGDTFFISSHKVTQDYIVSDNYTNYNDNKIIPKNIGDIKLYQNSYPRFQTGTSKEPDYYNKANQVVSSWPTWLKTRYTDNLNKIPTILRVVTDYNNGNVYGKNTYYAFIEYNGKINLVYLDTENEINNYQANQGVPTTISLFNGTQSREYYFNNFKMNALNKFLFLVGKTCG